MKEPAWWFNDPGLAAKNYREALERCAVVSKTPKSTENPRRLKKSTRASSIICKVCGSNKTDRPLGWRTRGVRIGFLRKRDGDNCHLCGLPILFDYPERHALFASVDHIIPVSKRGCDCPMNVKLAHKKCNHSRGNNSALFPGNGARKIVINAAMQSLGHDDPRRTVFVQAEEIRRAGLRACLVHDSDEAIAAAERFEYCHQCKEKARP